MSKPNPFWDRFLVEGDALFEYMIHNFEQMIDGFCHIKHFVIRSGESAASDSVDELNESQLKDIETELVPWIKHEYENQRLFDKLQWKPIMDPCHHCYMFLGYKHMFKFKQYYFQLALEEACEQCTHEDAKQPLFIVTPHFELALYGWEIDGSDKLQPYNRVVIPYDNIMPAFYWK